MERADPFLKHINIPMGHSLCTINLARCHQVCMFFSFIQARVQYRLSAGPDTVLGDWNSG